MAALQEVFGISTNPVQSYVERKEVDKTFSDALTSHQHIVVYGSSKQGKTALRQKHMREDQCTVVRCGLNTSIETIYQAILRDSGVKLEVFETKESGFTGTTKAKWGFKAMLSWVGSTEVEGEVSVEASKQRTIQSEYVGHDLADAQSIIELLLSAKYNKFIVLENFHYLTDEVQRSLAFDLKSFHEVGIRFLVLGIWQEANLLLLYNGDLEARIVEIPVEPWSDIDFNRVIMKGADILNIEIPASSISAFIDNAYGNIGMLQEFLRVYCRFNNVEGSEQSKRVLENGDKVEDTFDYKLESQRGRLRQVLEGIAGKSRTDGNAPLILPYYLVKVLLSTPISELQTGIRRQDLLEKVRAVHHRTEKETIRSNDIVHLLKRLPAHQIDIQPPLLHYDANQQRLKVVDTSQFFSLARIDRNELLDEIPNPLEIYE
jgi:hypothetical protein